jgi:hypothetical protein
MWWTVIEWLYIPGTAVLAVVGIWAVAAPQSFLAFNRTSNNWVETGSMERKLDASSNILDRFVYRHHMISGGILALASLATLFIALFLLPAGAGMAMQGWEHILYESLLGFFCLTGMAGLAVGMIIFARPSLLKPAESWGNRSVSSGQVFQKLEQRVTVLDDWVERRPRLFGILVLVMFAVLGTAAFITHFQSGYS